MGEPGQETNNHTHGYGAHVRVRWRTWRADTNRGTTPPPDGSSKPMRFQGRGDYPNFKPALQAPLTPGGVGGAYAPLNAGWVVD